MCRAKGKTSTSYKGQEAGGRWQHQQEHPGSTFPVQILSCLRLLPSLSACARIRAYSCEASRARQAHVKCTFLRWRLPLPSTIFSIVDGSFHILYCCRPPSSPPSVPSICISFVFSTSSQRKVRSSACNTLSVVRPRKGHPSQNFNFTEERDKISLLFLSPSRPVLTVTDSPHLCPTHPP